MAPTPQRRSRQRFRRYFRWCRIGFLLFVLLLLGCLTYLNRVGVPEFLKARLVAELRSRGVVLGFTRMRLRWYHGLVAENVRLGRADAPAGPRLSVGEIDIKLDRAALHELRLRVDSLLLHDGRLVLPLPFSGGPPEQFVLNDIMTELRLLPEDRWELDRFTALCLGARIELSGTLTNATAVRGWRFQRPAGEPAFPWQTRLRQVVRIVRQMRFRHPPVIVLDLRGDARVPAGLTADLRLSAPRADTAWGELEKLVLNAKLNRPLGSNDLGYSELKLELDGARTQWGRAQRSRLELQWAQSFTNPMPADVDVDLELTKVATPWGTIPQAHFSGRSRRLPERPDLLQSELTLDSGVFQSDWFQLRTNRFTARLVHAADSASPLRADWRWGEENPESRLGGAEHFELNGRGARAPAESTPGADDSWAWWAALEPFEVDWESRADRLSITNVVLDKLVLAGHWRAPELAIHRIHAALYGRQMDARAAIHVATREARAQGEFDFDLRRLESLLTPFTRRWLGQYGWSEPPRVSAEARAILPAWTNHHPDWRAEVRPTLRLTGELQAGEGSFRGLPVSSARTHFSFSNSVWRLPDFVATRPEGGVEFSYTSDMTRRDYHFQGRAQVDPMALRPLFPENPPRIFELFKFHEPPELAGDVWGQWGDPEKLGATVRVRATNFVFREVPVSDLTAAVSFTNRFLAATDVVVGGGGPQITAAGLGFDLPTQTLYLTNAVSTVDPRLVPHAIGPQTERILSPYLFVWPPHARADGWVEVRKGKKSDLRFEIAGGPFHYWTFTVPQVSGDVRWVSETVIITNLQADFYRGKLGAHMFFDCAAPRAADFNLRIDAANADLRALMADLSSPTNRLEGSLSGDLTVTHANTADFGSWNGFGRVNVRDGFLWDIPLFGIFSSVLNAVVPGLGSSRVSGATAAFTMTNSVIHTDDMEIHSPAMRLAYRGTIDFKGRVDARVEARLLRDAWIIGPLVSLVFSPLTKLFEYKVTGTLHEPQKEPLYIPKPLTFPFHPFRTLKELFGEEKPAPPSPAPSEKPPPH